MRIRFPSEQAPGFPVFSLDVPDEWRADTAPDAAVVLVDPTASSDFRPNLTVGFSRVAADTSLDDIDSVARAEMRPGYELAWEKETEVAGEPAIICLLSIRTDEAAFTIAQLQCLFFAPAVEGVEIKDLVRVYGTCKAIDAEHYVDLFAAMLASFRFEGPKPPTA